MTLNLSLLKYGQPYIKEQTDLLHNLRGVFVYFIWDYRVYHFLAASWSLPLLEVISYIILVNPNVLMVWASKVVAPSNLCQKKLLTVNRLDLVVELALWVIQASWRSLPTSPSPTPPALHLPKRWPSGAWDQGEPKWRLIMAPLSTMFNFKSNAQRFCKNAAWSFRTVVY